MIICFHKERLSVLLRTIHSVINRTPPELLTEIIVVDDFSEDGKLAINIYEVNVTLLIIIK